MSETNPASERERAAASDYLNRARSDVVRGSLWTTTATLVTLPITFVASIFVARSLGPEGLGRFATYIAAFAIVSALSNLGWSEATVQWLASAMARGIENDGSTLIRRCAGYHLWVAGPAAAATAFLLLMSSGTIIALSAAVIVWGTQILGTSTVILTAGARNAMSAQIALVATTATQLALLTTALASHAAALTWTVQLGFLLLGPAIAVAALKPWERNALLRPQLSIRVPKGFFVYAFSACAAGLVGSLVFGRSELFVLRAHDLLAAVGVFTIVTGLASQLTGPLDSMLAPLTPIAAGLVAIDRHLARRTFTRSLRVSAALGTVAACVIVPLGVTVIEPLYGPGYSAAPLPFLAMGLVSCLQTVLGPVGAFAFATRSAGQVLKVNLIALAADAALVLSLVPFIGLWGAVAANAAAQLVSLSLLTVIVSRKLEMPLKTIAIDIRLFAVGLSFGGAEGLACWTLAGPARLLAPLVVLAGVSCLWIALRQSPSLRLAEDDLAIIARGSTSRVVAGGINLLRRAGVVRDVPVV